jgi:hypothetical protein
VPLGIVVVLGQAFNLDLGWVDWPVFVIVSAVKVGHPSPPVTRRMVAIWVAVSGRRRQTRRLATGRLRGLLTPEHQISIWCSDFVWMSPSDDQLLQRRDPLRQQGGKASLTRVEDGCELGTAAYPELGVEVVEVIVDRADRQDQALSDLSIGQSLYR